jgi:hypothetical protein
MAVVAGEEIHNTSDLRVECKQNGGDKPMAPVADEHG